MLKILAAILGIAVILYSVPLGILIGFAIVGVAVTALWFVSSFTPEPIGPHRGSEEMSEASDKVNEDEGFYIGGVWDEDFAPSTDDCINAWSLFLVEAKLSSPVASGEERERLVNRALYILNLAALSEEEHGEVFPDLLYLLEKQTGLAWLQNWLVENPDQLGFDYAQTLKKSKASAIEQHLGMDSAKLTQEKIRQIHESIPSYDAADILRMAREFNDFCKIRDGEFHKKIQVNIEAVEPTCFRLAAGELKWGGKVLVETGLVRVNFSRQYSVNGLPDVSALKEVTWEELYEIKEHSPDYFMCSQVTVEHEGEIVPVIACLDDEFGSYVRTVNESRISYDILEEKQEVPIDEKGVTCVTFIAGELQAVFDIGNDQISTFLESVREEGANPDAK